MATTSPDLMVAVDRYIEDLCVARDPVFSQALVDARTAGLPPINVSANEGKLLYMLARLCGAKRILEIGLLGGYSALWLGKALPRDGRLVSLELSAPFAAVAKANLARAGLAELIDIRIGAALDSLKAMVQARETPFDLVFIDADKVNYPHYLEWVLKLVHPGSVILADNVIRGGEVLEKGGGSPDLKGIQAFNTALSGNPRLESILLPIVRESIDGLAIARVVS